MCVHHDTTGVGHYYIIVLGIVVHNAAVRIAVHIGEATTATVHVHVVRANTASIALVSTQFIR